MLGQKLLKNLLLMLIAAPMGNINAEIDLTGEWAPRYHEDLPERIPGPSIGEFHGIPINEAARIRGESWDSSILSVPEHQCKPHPADYATRGPSHMRIWKTLDRASQQVTAIRLHISWSASERTIWMDGRGHPPDYGAHSWHGFSTGIWEGDQLTVTTTHLKQGWLRRNGLPRSEKAILREHFIRHGNYLTHISIIEDDVFLTEPFIRSQNWVLEPFQQIGPYLCEIAVEVDRPQGTVPHYLFGQNPFLNEYATRYGIPIEAAMGGAETMYPGFIE